MKTLLLLIILLLNVSFINAADRMKDRPHNGPGRCTGSASCRVCTNCSRCAHCGSGGSCGVCAGSSSGRSYTSSRKSRSRKSVTTYSSPNVSAAGRTETRWRLAEAATLRKGAATGSAALRKLPAGTFVQVITMNSDWAKVRLPGTTATGYLPTASLRLAE